MAMYRNGVDENARKQIQAHVIGGYQGDDFAITVKDVLNRWFNIKNILTDTRVARSLSVAIDARSGEVFALIDIIPKNQPPDKSEWYQAAIKTSKGAHITTSFAL